MKNITIKVLMLFILCFSILAIGCGGGSSDEPAIGTEPHSDPSKSETKQLVSKRVTQSQNINEAYGNLSIAIPNGAVGSDYNLEILQTLNSKENFPWLSDFEQLSDLYTINISRTASTKEPLLENPGTIKLTANNDYPTNQYYIGKRNDGKWFLLRPEGSTPSSLSFKTHTFSDWVLLKKKQKSAIYNAPIITASPSTILTNGSQGTFKNNLEIKICTPYEGGIGNGKLILQSRDNAFFTVKVNSGKLSTASVRHEIDFATLGQPETSGELATYTAIINLEDKVKSEMPDFIILSAYYSDQKGISYINQAKVTFTVGQEEKPDIKAPSVVSSEPANGSKARITLDDSVSIVFSEEMDTTSVESALKIEPQVSNIQKKWSNNSKNLVINADFESDTTYKLSISDKALSKANKALLSIFSLVFQTVNAPRISSTIPANNSSEIALDTDFVINFSESMNRKSVEASISVTPKLSDSLQFKWDDKSTKCTVIFPAKLASKTTYKIEIAKTAKSANGAGLLSNKNITIKTIDTGTGTETGTETGTGTGTETGTETGTGTGTGTGTEISVEQPEIISFVPTDLSENVAINSKIEIKFSKEMNKESVTAAISFVPALSDNPVYSWTDNQTLIITPSVGWQPDMTYKVMLSETAKSSDNQKLNSFISVFSTSRSPVILAFMPENKATDISLDSSIKITFSNSMNKEKTEAAITINTEKADRFTTNWNNSATELEITPPNQWPENQYIRLNISNTAEDASGLRIANSQSYIFQTQLLPAVVPANCKPLNGSVYNDVSTTISVAFNKEVNLESAQSAFSLRKDNSTISLEGSFEWNKSTMIFTPASNLESNTRYNVSVSQSVYDSLNAHPIATTSWSFTTAPVEGDSWNNLFVQDVEEENFTPRTNQAMVVFDNKLWMIGGKDYSGEALSQIFSSSDGKNWSLVTNNPGFTGRYGHSCTVYDNKIWLTGGIDANGTYCNDVWNSSDGKAWTCIAESVDTTDLVTETRFSRRAYHNLLTYKNKLWIMLGEGPNSLMGDIWCSTDGIIWEDRSGSEIPRKSAAAVVFNEEIMIIGGFGNKSTDGSSSALSDVWSFNESSTVWRSRSTNTAISPRFAATATVFNNRIWLIGGTDSNKPATFFKEVWASNNGTDWVELSTPEQEGKAYHSAVAKDSSIIIAGGENKNNIFNEVWSVK